MNMDRESFNAEVLDLIEQSSDEVFDDVFITTATPDASTLSLEERFGRLEVFKRPQRLIYTDTDNRLTIHDKVLDQISCIDVPLNVVAVCGLYRTGKSYLMNRLANEKTVPAGSKKLSRIETLREHELDVDFVADVNHLQAFVYDCEPKVLDAATKKPVDGLAFESFTRTYIKAFENDSALTFEKAFEQASRYHNSKLVVKLVHEFRSDIQHIQLPKKTKQSLNDECFIYMNKALKTYRAQAYPYKSDFFEGKAVSKMRAFVQEKLEENSAAVQTLFLRTLKTMHDEVIKRNKTRYNAKEGFELYRQDLDTMELKFQEKMKEYDRDEQTTAMVSFKLSIKDEKMKVSFRARMHEEKERNEELRKEVQESLKLHFAVQLEEMEQERIKKMDEEMATFQKNLTERMGVEAMMKQSFFKRLQLLFSS